MFSIYKDQDRGLHLVLADSSLEHSPATKQTSLLGFCMEIETKFSSKPRISVKKRWDALSL